MKKIANSHLFLPFVEEFISNSKSAKRIQSNGKKLTSGTIRNYQYLLNHLKGFEAFSETQIRIKIFTKLNKTSLQVEKKLLEEVL